MPLKGKDAPPRLVLPISHLKQAELPGRRAVCGGGVEGEPGAERDGRARTSQGGWYNPGTRGSPADAPPGWRCDPLNINTNYKCDGLKPDVLNL